MAAGTDKQLSRLEKKSDNKYFKRRVVVEGYSIESLLKLMKWEKGMDFKKVFSIPLIVGAPHPASSDCFKKVKVVIEY